MSAPTGIRAAAEEAMHYAMYCKTGLMTSQFIEIIAKNCIGKDEFLGSNGAEKDSHATEIYNLKIEHIKEIEKLRKVIGALGNGFHRVVDAIKAAEHEANNIK